MTKARIVNLLFQVLAAFWAVIVILRDHTGVRWHAYAIAAVGIIVISVTGTRIKHRMLKRQKANAAEAPMAATQT